MIEFARKWFSSISEDRCLITPLMFAMEYERVKQEITREAPTGSWIPLDLEAAKKRFSEMPRAALRLSLNDFTNGYIRTMVMSDLASSWTKGVASINSSTVGMTANSPSEN